MVTISSYSTDKEVILAFSLVVNYLKTAGFRKESNKLKKNHSLVYMVWVLSKIPNTSFRNSVEVPEIMRIKNQFYANLKNQRIQIELIKTEANKLDFESDSSSIGNSSEINLLELELNEKLSYQLEHQIMNFDQICSYIEAIAVFIEKSWLNSLLYDKNCQLDQNNDEFSVLLQMFVNSVDVQRLSQAKLASKPKRNEELSAQVSELE